jgi:hypothetical protein
MDTAYWFIPGIYEVTQQLRVCGEFRGCMDSCPES